MKIKSVRLQSFRNHTDSSLELDSFNVLRGANFAGKSSVAQGISMLLTPTTTSLDATGRGFAVKIKRGSPKAIITGVIQGSKHTIERIVTLNTNTSGRTDSSKCLSDPDFHPSPFERLLDANRAALAVCLNTDRFFTMDEKDQKSLLAKLAFPNSYDFPEETMDAVDKALGEGTVDFDAEPFAVIEKAYKLLYKERELVNRQAKEFVIPSALPDVAGFADAASLQKQLTEARERQRTIAAERDAATANNGDANVKRAKLQGRVDTLKEKIKEEEKRVKDVEWGLLSESRLKDLRKVAEGKTTFDKLERERQVILTRITVKKNKVESYAKLTGISGECPTCHQDIDAEIINELRRKAAEELTTQQNLDSDTLHQMKNLGDVTGALKAIADHDKAVAAQAEINTVITEKNKLLHDATNELNKLPTTTDTLLPFVKPLDEVDAEITSLLAKLQPAMAAEERKKEIATKTEQMKKLQAKAVSIDALVKYFDKDGIKAKLLVEHVGGFVEKMNVVMDAFGYKVTLDIEPEFMFVVTDTTNVLTPVKELSGSEQLMFMVALQCAVSRAAGIGIVVADKLDTFLPAQRSKANKVLYTLLQGGMLDQVFAIMSDESETVPNLPNSAFFLVEAGAVRRLNV